MIRFACYFAVLPLVIAAAFSNEASAQNCRAVAQQVAAATGAEIATSRAMDTFQLNHRAAPGGSQIVCGAPSIMFSAYSAASSPAFVDYVTSAASAMTKSDATLLRRTVENCVASGNLSLDIPVGIDMRGINVECLVSKRFGGSLSITIYRRRDF